MVSYSALKFDFIGWEDLFKLINDCFFVKIIITRLVIIHFILVVVYHFMFKASRFQPQSFFALTFVLLEFKCFII